MAKFLAILGDIRGKLGGNVFSRNRNGAYVRQKVTPVNPDTSGQATIRSIFGSLSSNWSAVLTEGVRNGYKNYAAGTPLTGVFGNQYTLTGNQMYVRLNTPRLQAGQSALTAAPVTLGQSNQLSAVELNAATVVDSHDGATNPNKVVITLASLPGFPADSTGALLFIQSSIPQGPGINFFKGPFAFIGAVVGDSVTPPTTFEYQYPYDLYLGDKMFFRVRWQDAEGRLSPSTIYTEVTITSV